MGYANSRDAQVQLVEEKKEEIEQTQDDKQQSSSTATSAGVGVDLDNELHPEDNNGIIGASTSEADEPLDMQQDNDDLDTGIITQNSLDAPTVLSLNEMLQLQQQQANLAAQQLQLLEQAHQTQLMTSSLGSMALNPATAAVALNNPAAALALNGIVPPQVAQQLAAAAVVPPPVVPSAVPSVVPSNVAAVAQALASHNPPLPTTALLAARAPTIAPGGGVMLSPFVDPNSAVAAVHPAVAQQVGLQQQVQQVAAAQQVAAHVAPALGINGINPIAAAPLITAAGGDPTAMAAPLLAAATPQNPLAAQAAALNTADNAAAVSLSSLNANGGGGINGGPIVQVPLATTANLDNIAASITNNNPNVPISSNGIQQANPTHHATHQLSPQMTIPHYVPPIPSTWGAQVPALSVQDRPLVPPVYNGINPNYPGAQLLHAHPPIFVVDNFLSHAECDFLIDAASDAFGPAPVVGKGSGEVSPSRTSSTCYLAREDLPEYLRKVSLLTGKPPEHCELPQVGRYMPSQQYLQHFDAFDLSNEDGQRFAANGGQRTVTVLVYLNDVPRGGATAFPNLNIEVQPRRGMALVFFPSTLDGLLDKMALHSALPAVDVKFVSQVWIRQGNYEGRPSKRLREPMVAGLQERRERVAQELAAAQVAQQQQQQHHHPQAAMHNVQHAQAQQQIQAQQHAQAQQQAHLAQQQHAQAQHAQLQQHQIQAQQQHVQVQQQQQQGYQPMSG